MILWKLACNDRKHVNGFGGKVGSGRRKGLECYEETLVGEGYGLYLDYSDNSRGIYMYQNLSSCMF